MLFLPEAVTVTIIQSVSSGSIFQQEIRQFVTKISVWAAAGICFHQEKDSFIHLPHLPTGGAGRGMHTPVMPWDFQKEQSSTWWSQAACLELMLSFLIHVLFFTEFVCRENPVHWCETGNRDIKAPDTSSGLFSFCQRASKLTDDQSAFWLIFCW